MILATEVHDASMVRHKFQQNPFRQASSKMYEPMTLESLKMPVDSMIVQPLMTSVCLKIRNSFNNLASKSIQPFVTLDLDKTM